MESKKSLNSIANSISDELFLNSPDGKEVISYKTLIRNFEKFIEKSGGDIKSMKDSSGKIFFEESESIFIKAILRESIDKNSYIYKFLKGKDDEVSFDQIKEFMDNIHDYMQNKLPQEECDAYMAYMDQALQYSVIMELHNIYNIIECINLNLQNYIYTFQLESMINLRKKLEQEFVRTTANSILNMEEFCEFVSQTSEIFDGDASQLLNYDDFDLLTQVEYSNRDKDTLKYINSNPLIKKHIEEKIGKSIDEIFKGVINKID
ncbi:MAG: hypothetical protein U0N84_02365 [Terrisporobacter sp.]|uniref:hypothetical protein n=1 Tax=Terrisporobacter sp. TaxID=1965305 RepID=UPI002F940BF9